MSKQPTKKKAERKGKPAGGYIGQAMEAARANRAKPINRNALVTTIRHIVREELGLIEQIKAEKFTRAEIMQSEPTEAEIEALAMVIYNASPMAGVPYSVHQDKAVKCARAAYAHLRSKP